MQQTCQKHATCKYLASQNASYSAAVIPVMYYTKNVNTWVFGSGLERGGMYKDQYSLCAGKQEPSDTINGGFCWLKCAQRELAEEFKIDASFNGNFDILFRGSNQKIRVFLFKRTPVFIALLPNGTSRQPIKHQMHLACMDPNMPWSHKEMSDFEFFRLDNGSQIEGKNSPLSAFANGVRACVNVNAL